MDGARFDELTRRIGRGVSRRGLLRGLAGVALGGTLTRSGLRDAAAACPHPEVACPQIGGTCVNLRTDPENCGRCGRVCASGLCYAARCTDSCPSGFEACGGSCVRSCPGEEELNPESCTCACPANAPDPCGNACRDFATDPGNCGGCAVTCVAGPNVAAVACVNGDCVITDCVAGHANCDGDFATGCEAALDSPDTCGSCVNTCTAPEDASAICVDGSCDFVCDQGFRRCGDGCIPDGSDSCCTVDECPAPTVGTCQTAATCEGNVCGFAPAEAGTVCHQAPADACLLDAVCDGVTTECPPNPVQAEGVVCREATDVCDLPAVCDGESAVCPENPLKEAGTECRASTGLCDPAEFCTGESAACPDDVRLDDGESCGDDRVCCDEICCAEGHVCGPDGCEFPPLVIDDFSTAQAEIRVFPHPAQNPSTNSSFVSGGGILGGQRDIYVEADENPDIEHQTLAMITQVAGGQFETFRQTGVTGRLEMQWDGEDDDAVNLNPTGLGGVDLTKDGMQTGVLLRVPHHNTGVNDVAITVYTDGANASRGIISLQLIQPGPRDYVLPFTAFSMLSGAGADFTNVGAITLSFNATAGVGPYISLFQTTT